MTTAPVGGSLIEIGQARQPETVGAVHDGVAGKHRIETMRLAGVRTDGLHADTENIALLCQERHALRMKPGVCEPSGPALRNSFAPVRCDQSVRISTQACDGNAAVLALPLLHDLPRQEEVRIRFRLRGHIDDAGGTDEALDRNVVGGVVRDSPCRSPSEWAHRNACRCARRTRCCSSTRRARARRSGKSPPAKTAWRAQTAAAAGCVGVAGSSGTVRSTTRMPSGDDAADQLSKCSRHRRTALWGISLGASSIWRNIIDT